MVILLCEQLSSSSVAVHCVPSSPPASSERVKKLKKRGLDDVEFFRSTAVYLQQCAANAMSGKMEVRTSAAAG